jgi:mannose-6-phosphate isomerase-like protein (cupin superfamily)
MRSRLLLALTSVILGAVTLGAQTPPAPQTKPAPAARRPAVRPATLAIHVTDLLGASLPNAQVTIQGPVSREGTTAADGTLRLANMLAGTYRLRFDREGSIALERDVILRAGESATIDVALSPAPMPTPEPPREETPKLAALEALPPPGDPKLTPVPSFLEKNYVGRGRRRDSVLGCAATGTATLHQLRDAWANHTHDDADEWIYVVAGEGVLRMGTSEHRLVAGTFSLVPHTLGHTLTPQGTNPLIVISVLSGQPCQAEAGPPGR